MLRTLRPVTTARPTVMMARRILAFVVGTLLVVATAGARDMATAAEKFLSALTPEQRAQAAFAFGSPDRTKWHFFPPELFARGGLMLRDLDADQKLSARGLLQTGLSQHGYLTADAIMELEKVVRALPGNRFRFDPEEYYISVFGTPDPHGTWGWRFEGHHLSLHFTVVDGALTVSTPTFTGTNPAELREGPGQGQRPLGEQEDRARELVQSLSAAQRAQAMLADTALPDIVSGVAWPIEPLSPAGLLASDMTDAQRALLERLIGSYTELMADEIAAARWKGIRNAGLDRVGFAWAGPTARGQPHYFRAQGPTFLIEYDNTQNGANHAHSVWRDFKGDFGTDLLRRHYAADPSHR